MPYLETYKSKRIFNSEKGYYCIDYNMRKSILYESLSELKKEIARDNVKYDTPRPMDNSEGYLNAFLRRNVILELDELDTNTKKQQKGR